MMADQWSDIPRPDHPGLETERRAYSRHPLDFFRGRDFHGRYVFWLESTLERTSISDLPILSEIDATVTERSPGRCRLALTLMNSDHKDLFGALCANLMHATRGLPRGHNEHGIAVVVDQLKRWQELLRRCRDDILTRSKIIGLVGELLFLRDRVLERFQPLDAVVSWRGPYGDEQDFVFGTQVVEVKTQIASADRRVRISSEDQLDTHVHKITLVHQTLGPVDREDAAARTLNQLITELSSTFTDHNIIAADLFRSALIEAGWRERPEYDATAWVCAGTAFYDVCEGFPRIVPSDLPTGVERVSYALQLEKCSEYVIDENEAKRRIFDRHE